MLTPPLLSEPLMKSIADLLKHGKTDEIIELLKDLPVDAKIHYLRHLYHKSADKDIPCIYAIWQSFIPLDHILNTEQCRNALYEIGQWWHVFNEAEDRIHLEYDTLELVLEELGATAEGRAFFKWVALYPVGIEKWLTPHAPRMAQWLIWDEHRRGAVICLARYAYNRSTELFLARHLDDWNTIQIDVIELLAALRSRVLARLAPWYIRHDTSLRPILEEYGFEDARDEEVKATYAYNT